jgi:hypothetical protein
VAVELVGLAGMAQGLCGPDRRGCGGRGYTKGMPMKYALAVLILISARCVASAQKPDANGLNYGELVEGLASPNRPIKCLYLLEDVRGVRLSIPPNYDWKTQERIETNRQMLFHHCEEALPFLIDGCTDARYSLTAPYDSDYTYSWCVGQICQEIIASHVEVFRAHMSFDGPHDWNMFNFVPRVNRAFVENITDKEKAVIRDWWKKHSGKTMRELQLEAFDWAIDKRNEERQQAVKGSEQETFVISDIKRLVASREKLRTSGKCLPPNKMASSVLSTERYRVAPWTEEEEDRNNPGCSTGWFSIKFLDYCGFGLSFAFGAWWIIFPRSVTRFYAWFHGGRVKIPSTLGIRMVGTLWLAIVALVLISLFAKR